MRFFNYFYFTACGGILRSNDGILRSSDADSTFYEHYLDCTWIILAPVGRIIQMTWLSFDVEDSSMCHFDSVQVFDNSSTGGLMGTYCGSSVPPTTVSSSNIVTITFKTDGSRNAGGFSLSYRFLDATTCEF